MEPTRGSAERESGGGGRGGQKDADDDGAGTPLKESQHFIHHKQHANDPQRWRWEKVREGQMQGEGVGRSMWASPSLPSSSVPTSPAPSLFHTRPRVLRADIHQCACTYTGPSVRVWGLCARGRQGGGGRCRRQTQPTPSSTCLCRVSALRLPLVFFFPPVRFSQG